MMKLAVMCNIRNTPSTITVNRDEKLFLVDDDFMEIPVGRIKAVQE